MPDTLTLQTAEKYRKEFVEYSVQDAKITWFVKKSQYLFVFALINRNSTFKRDVRNILEMKLRELEWNIGGKRLGTLWDFYIRYMLAFGEVLTELEREGIRIDMDQIKKIEPIALEDLERASLKFRLWASQYCPDALLMNISSDQQKRHFLFAPMTNPTTGEELPHEKQFKLENTLKIVEEGKKKASKHHPFTIQGLGLPFNANHCSKSGWPQVSNQILKELAGNPHRNPPKYGTAYDHFGDPLAGAGKPTKFGCLPNLIS